ncbi:ABC transporter substrate-binding protein [Streptomyces sp. NPDC058773]|uniref:ABC transporter substrate-binding protein n=1 Tax=Streptomyces sp. NPDC058773 TaxID=3346632 RepID=UPI0036A33E77
MESKTPHTGREASAAVPHHPSADAPQVSGRLPRRKALQVAGAALATLGLAAAPSPTSFAAPRSRPKGEEVKSLEELYADARAEGGRLTIYGGGDFKEMLAPVEEAWARRFPGVVMTMIVDYSKFHDVRVDNQLATDTLVPDVVHFQTLHDFPRWKQEGKLLPYKPAGFDKVHDIFKDSDGAWTAVAAYAFSYLYDTAAVGGAPPRSVRDLADPKWKGKIASSYPNDDDATLYLYKLYAEKYGWPWLSRLMGQDIQFQRGTNNPGDAVRTQQKTIAIGTASVSALASPRTEVEWVLPTDDPFMAWGQRAAILAGAKHTAAAKLYLNWLLSTDMQAANNAFGWPVRTDVPTAPGLKPIWEYGNAHLDGFAAFMADRAEVERWRQTLTLYVGEVQGAPSPTWLGLHPGAAR